MGLQRSTYACSGPAARTFLWQKLGKTDPHGGAQRLPALPSFGPSSLQRQEMLVFAASAAVSQSCANCADCGEKRTNWDHDLAQLAS
jgi:hypothetical protein